MSVSGLGWFLDWGEVSAGGSSYQKGMLQKLTATSDVDGRAVANLMAIGALQYKGRI